MRRTRFFAALAATALFFAACGDDDTSETSTEGTPEAEAANETETLEAASIALTVEPDAKKGFNVLTEIEGFTFTPENASGDHVAGEGHAHIYADGEKLTRLYTNDYHLTGLEEGSHEIMVELNTNDHRPYVDADGEPVADMVTIEVAAPAEEDAGHSHDGADTETIDGASVSFSVEPDAKAGFNLVADVGGFEFNGAAASSPHVAGEGHAHVYVDGEKVARIYGPAYYLTGLSEGSHEIMVELNTNDHRPYLDADGEPVASMVTIEVTADQAQAASEGHSHGGDDMDDMPEGDTGAASAEGNVTVVVAGGSVEGPDRVEASAGETVKVTATSDVTDEIHVHGTDDRFDITAGETLDFEFVADIPGVFEVELENNGILLFELAVR